MQRNLRITSLAAVAVAALLSQSSVTPSASAQQWGTLKGKFVFDGPAPAPVALRIDKDPECCKVKHNDESVQVAADGGLANVVLYVRTPKVAVHPDYEKTAKDDVVLDNKTCHFEPHIVVVRLTQTLLIKNTDTCGHNTNVAPLGDTAINPLLPPAGEFKHTFRRQQNLPFPVSCNIHPWMKAHVLVRDNPYFAVSAADGTFEIANLPAGDLEFQAWHEVKGYLEHTGWPKGKFKHSIKAGDNDLGTIKLSPALFKK